MCASEFQSTLTDLCVGARYAVPPQVLKADIKRADT